ncbi:MAG: FAD-dependent oxidoreductase [Deltaproteobacteria bacterium]|nr:FAD-dependent oxidoreductase [Deltaproteobacteria bacterium]
MTTPILIVGAGPAGASLAYALAARGVAVTLVERQRDFAREFRGEALMPSGVDALAQLGLGDVIPSVPHRVPDAIELFRGRKLVARVRASEVLPPGVHAYTVSQPHLLEAIVARASQHAGFTLLRGAAVRELLRNAAGRVCGVRVDGEGGARELAARFVVGADGRASVVRRGGGFAVTQIWAPMDVVWARLPWPACYVDAQPVRGYVGHGHLLIALPSPSGGLQVAWVIRKGTYGDLRSRGIEDWVRAMADHVSPDLAEHFRASAAAVSRPFLLDAETDRVRGWAKPGALLIGDAAHTMSPVGAQGINVALRDAVAALNALAPALRANASDAELDAAAACVEPERGPEIDEIQGLARRPPVVVMGTYPGAEWVRALLLGLATSPLGRRAVARVGAKFLCGTREVKLVA